MRRMIFTVLLLAGIAGVARADEKDQSADRSVRILLFSHHGPPAASVFEKAVPDARARLMRMAADEAPASASIRDRALIALAGFGGDDVRRMYDRVLADRAVAKVARIHVLTAYARAFPAQARVVLERARTAEDAELRVVAEAQLKLLTR